MKKLMLFVFGLVLSAPAFAGMNKFTFNDVNIGGQIVEIEASSRTGGSPYTTCRYFADDYANYIGRYDEPGFGSADGSAVELFCVENFGNAQ